MRDLSERLDEMEEKIRSPKLRQSSGRANEVNYWVFDYPPERELEVRERIKYLQNKNARGNEDFSLIVQHIKDNTPENAVVFLTGVGKCYPLLRSHKVLNNLHQAFVRVPVVMFFPGVYNEQELILFGEIKDDNYYRAFKLVK